MLVSPLLYVGIILATRQPVANCACGIGHRVCGFEAQSSSSILHTQLSQILDCKSKGPSTSVVYAWGPKQLLRAFYNDTWTLNPMNPEPKTLF